MSLILKKAFKGLTRFGAKAFHKQLRVFFFAICSFTVSAQCADKVFIQSTQGIQGIGCIETAPDGTLLATTPPNLIQKFNPFTKKWEGTVFKYPNNSFGNTLTLLPNGLATAGIDGLVWTSLNDGSLIRSTWNKLKYAPNTGKIRIEYDPAMIGIDSFTYKSSGIDTIAYRKSDDVLYMATNSNPFQILRMNWQGSTVVPLSVSSSPPKGYGWGAWQFGPHDLLYSPDTKNNQIIAIDVNINPMKVQTVVPSTLLDPLDIPVALKIDSQGNLYFIGRRTGNVFKWVIETKQLTLLATLQPALNNLCLSLDEKNLYVSNDENKLVQIDVNTGATKTLFESPIVKPWDIAYDSETKSLYVADSGSLKQFNAASGKLERSLIADSTTSGLANIGQINGITVEQGPDAKIVITDITVGSVMVLNKKDLSVYKIFNIRPPVSANTGTSHTQPFSTVRVVSKDKPSGEYYLATTPFLDLGSSRTTGKIVQFWENPNIANVSNSDFFTGLWNPVKLKVYKGYLYVVEAGDLLNEPSLSPGRISRIALSDPSSRQILVDNLNNPQGLDIVDDQMYIVEAGTKSLLKASAIIPTTPVVLRKDLDLSNDIYNTVVSPYFPIPINPPATVAVEEKGKGAFISLTQSTKIIRAGL